MKKRMSLLRLVLILLPCLILPGCWDVRDIDNRLLVATLGIEQGENNKVVLWVRFPIPQSSQSLGGGLDKGFFTSRQEGETAIAALDELRLRLPKALDMSATRAIFLDQKLAEKGLKPYLEFAIRDRTIPLSTIVALVSGPMESIFTKPNPAGELSGIYTQLFFEPYAGGTPQKNMVPLWSLFSRMYNNLQENLVPLLVKSQINMFELQGNAYFSDDKLVGMITPSETLIYEIVTRRMSGFEIETTQGADVKILKNNTRISSKMVKGKPVIHIHTKLIMTLMDSSQATKVDTRQIEKSVNQLLEERARGVFQQTKLNKSDIFGFGNRFRGQLSPSQQKDWPDLYESAAIDIDIDSTMRNTGLQLMK